MRGIMLSPMALDGASDQTFTHTGRGNSYFRTRVLATSLRYAGEFTGIGHTTTVDVGVVGPRRRSGVVGGRTQTGLGVRVPAGAPTKGIRPRGAPV